MKPDWWKMQVFYQKDYWATLLRRVDQELKVCSPLVQIIGCTCGCGSNCECTQENNCGCKCWEKK